MKFLSTFEKQILCEYFLKNIEYLCLEPHTFQKKCWSKSWVYKFFWELHFLIEESKSLSREASDAIAARIIKKYSKEKDFKNFFNRQIIYNLMIDTGKKETLFN